MHPRVEPIDDVHKVWMTLATVFGLVLYLKVIWHRERAALVEICLAAAYCFIIFPSGTFSSYVPDVKPGVTVPTCIFQLVFACLASQAISLQLTKRSIEPEVTLCTTVANILTRAGLALCALQGIVNVKTISNFSCMVTLVVLLPLIIGDLVHLFHMSVKYEITVGDPISWHISVDAMASFLLGCCIMAFPGLLFSKLDEATALVIKALGCMVVGQSLLSFGSLCFSVKDDALATLKAKLVMYMICMLAAAASYYTDVAFWEHGHPIYLFLISGALAHNAGSAVLHDALC